MISEKTAPAKRIERRISRLIKVKVNSRDDVLAVKSALTQFPSVFPSVTISGDGFVRPEGYGYETFIRNGMTWCIPAENTSTVEFVKSVRRGRDKLVKVHIIAGVVVHAMIVKVPADQVESLQRALMEFQTVYDVLGVIEDSAAKTSIPEKGAAAIASEICAANMKVVIEYTDPRDGERHDEEVEINELPQKLQALREKTNSTYFKIHLPKPGEEEV